MEKFNDNWKNKLIKNYGYGSTGQSDYETYIKWAMNNDIKCKLKEKDWRRLYKERFKNLYEHKFNAIEDKFRLFDHIKIFERFDGSRIFTFHPYHDIETLSDEGIHEWCSERGLIVTTIDDTEYNFYADNSVLVQIEIDDLNKYISYIEEHFTSKGGYKINYKSMEGNH